MRLSGGGWHVLRFDYYGTGDSAGEFEATTPDDWQADIEAAVGELDAISGTRSVQLVGVRLGATLAARAALRLPSVRRVVLGDPIYNGEGYLKQLAETHQRMLGPHYFDSGEHFGRRELVGFEVSTRMLQRLEEVVLPDWGELVDTKSVSIVLGGGDCDYETLKCNAGPHGVSLVQTGFDCDWDTDQETVLYPHEIVEALVAEAHGS